MGCAGSIVYFQSLKCGTAYDAVTCLWLCSCAWLIQRLWSMCISCIAVPFMSPGYG